MTCLLPTLGFCHTHRQVCSSWLPPSLRIKTQNPLNFDWSMPDLEQTAVATDFFVIKLFIRNTPGLVFNYAAPIMYQFMLDQPLTIDIIIIPIVCSSAVCFRHVYYALCKQNKRSELQTFGTCLASDLH